MDLGRLAPASKGLQLADHALSKMVRYVLLRPLRPELDGQDPFQICGRLCQTRKTSTLGGWSDAKARAVQSWIKWDVQHCNGGLGSLF
jgi:hypothetical protein